MDLPLVKAIATKKLISLVQKLLRFKDKFIVFPRLR